MTEKQTDDLIKLILLIPVILFRFAIRVVLGTVGVVAATPVVLLLGVLGVDVEPFWDAVDNWFLTGSFKKQ